PTGQAGGGKTATVATRPANTQATAMPSGQRGASAPGVNLGDYSPAVRVLIEEHRLDPRAITATGPGGRLTKEDVDRYLAERGASDNGREDAEPPPINPARGAESVAPPKPKDVATVAPPSTKAPAMEYDAQGIRRTPMSKIRKRIAERLVSAQQTAAILTT